MGLKSETSSIDIVAEEKANAMVDEKVRDEKVSV